MSDSVSAVSVPSPSLVGGALVPRHYADAYALEVAPGTFGSVDRLVRAATRLSLAGRALMALRDFVVRPFGLITVPRHLSRAPEGPLEVGSAAGMFKVVARSGDEVLLGLDDKHLDFRFSLMLRATGACEQAVATTTVRFHHVGGRIYFAFVKPVHKLLVPGMLRSAAKRARREVQ
jgi:hypothetical protein